MAEEREVVFLQRGEAVERQIEAHEMGQLRPGAQLGRLQFVHGHVQNSQALNIKKENRNAIHERQIKRL